MKTKLETISPDKAREILKGNKCNRTVRVKWVDALASEMTNGNFIPTHQGIAIYEDGDLADGQHRLLAIIESGKSVEMLVTRGMGKLVNGHDFTPQDVMDNMPPRSIPDQMGIHGIQYSNLTSSAVTAVGMVCCHFQRYKITYSKATDILRVYGKPIEHAINILFEYKPTRRGWFIATMAMAYIVEKENVDQFLIDVASGENLKSGSAALAMRNYLIEVPSTRGKSNPRIPIEAAFNCTFNYVKGNTYKMPRRGVHGREYFLGKQRGKVEAVRVLFSDEIESHNAREAARVKSYKSDGASKK